MKNMRKLASLLLALVMVFAMATTAFADGEETGSITIKPTTDISLTGRTFSAYKILDVVSYTDTTVVYTVPEALKDFYNTRYSLNGTEADYDYTVVEKIKAETDMFAFATAALAAAKTANITGTTGEISGENYVISNLALGYYVIEDTAAVLPASALMLDTTNLNAEVTIKADKPTIDKVDDDQSVEVGQVVNYTATSKVPDATGYTKYTYEVNDIMSDGLTFNKDVAITVNGVALSTEHYTIDYTVANGFKLTVDVLEIEDMWGQEIKLTYTATVNANAVTEVEENKITLTYSNNPNDEESKETTPEDKEKVYSAKIVIDKYDAVDTTKATKLSGAEFKLYKMDRETKKYYKGTFAEGVLTKVEWVTDENQATVVVTDDNGAANFDGLEDGTYYLVETKAPAGYNLLTDPVEVEVDGAAAVDASATQESIDAALTDTAQVGNNSGSELPSTGGMGTTLFYIVGGILVVAAVVLLVTKKRMAVAE